MNSSYREHYNKLNDEQKESVEHTEGPLLVLAGPGTGKTQLLSVRAANIILNKKALPGNILILTFTNAAARAMRDRLARIVGHDGYDVDVETFHSFANSIILQSEGAINFVKDKVEISDVERVKALQHILNTADGIGPLRPFGAPYIHMSDIQGLISELKNEDISPETLKARIKGIVPDVSDDDDKLIAKLKALAVIYEKYEKLKDGKSGEVFDQRGRIDFDDMILIGIKALEEDASLREHFRSQYKYIMVDEYQDTNPAQMELLFAIVEPGNSNICCVGDDDQSIYRFQGAALSNFRSFLERFPGTRTVELKKNYRSVQKIIDAAGAVIGTLPLEERVSRKQLVSQRGYASSEIKFLEFTTEEEELAFLADAVRKESRTIEKDDTLDVLERSKPYNNMAIIVRTRGQILKVIDALLKAGIPYATDGKEDIRTEKRVRQMLDVIELGSADPSKGETRSLALYKVLVSDYIGASHADVLKLISSMNAKKRAARDKKSVSCQGLTLLGEFEEAFFVFEKDEKGEYVRPLETSSRALPAATALKLEKPHALHLAAWAIYRFISDASSVPVHDLILRYINDTGLYRHILERYQKDKVIKLRELRALVSFVNMIKQSDLADPGLDIYDLKDELDLRAAHNMPIRGELATLSQDGVRVLTAHSSKGLEFYSVFMPFCLQQKSWPHRGKSDIIVLPQEICPDRERTPGKEEQKKLDLFDEIRLFYVATTRAKANIVYTATPAEKVILSPFFKYMGLDPKNGSPADEADFLAAFLEKIEVQDTPGSTVGVLEDMVSELTLNPTSLNNYINCGRKFLYDNVLMLPERKNQQLTFGNSAHKALEEVYRTYMDTGLFPGFGVFRDAFNRELKFQGVNKAIEKWCGDRLEELKDWYGKEASGAVMPLDLENKLEITIGNGIRFRGAFDKVERDGTEGIKVVDYKTGKPDKHAKAIHACKDVTSVDCDDYFRQLVAYKMLYDRSPGVKIKGIVTKGVLQFLERASKDVQKYDLVKGEYKKIEVELSEKDVKALEGLLMRCWDDIQSLKFDKLKKRDKDKCGVQGSGGYKCDYCDICWG
ncbi:MAG: ATP-dependent DNA helicase [Candidatus Omnitrophica bacterium]|nr:ATP-dependent DNA helicase [Candidatus Omnitrophota bacterium]